MKSLLYSTSKPVQGQFLWPLSPREYRSHFCGVFFSLSFLDVLQYFCWKLCIFRLMYCNNSGFLFSSQHCCCVFLKTTCLDLDCRICVSHTVWLLMSLLFFNSDFYLLTCLHWAYPYVCIVCLSVNDLGFHPLLMNLCMVWGVCSEFSQISSLPWFHFMLSSLRFFSPHVYTCMFPSKPRMFRELI